MQRTKPHCNDHLNLNSSNPEHDHWNVPLILERWVPVCEQIAFRLALTLPAADRLHQIILAAYDAMWLMVENSAEPHTLTTQYRFILFFLLHCFTGDSYPAIARGPLCSMTGVHRSQEIAR
jgi:hypothetical protein